MPPRSRRPAVRRSTLTLRVSAGFREYVLDQLAGLGPVVPRSMFGGVGLYSEGLFFGLIARDVLYLKVDAVNRGDYERAGMKPFKPYAHRPATMQYYEVPVSVLEHAPDLARWAKKSIAAAGRAARNES